MKVKASARLVNSELRSLRNGCGELILAEVARKLKFSTAARVGLPAQEQKSVVTAGAKEAARKVRELRGGLNFSEGRIPSASQSVSLAVAWSSPVNQTKLPTHIKHIPHSIREINSSIAVERAASAAAAHDSTGRRRLEADVGRPYAAVPETIRTALITAEAMAPSRSS